MLRLDNSFRTKPALVLLAALILSGCANRQNMTVGSIPDDYRTNHPISIAEREKVADIPVAHGDQRLTASQRSIVQNTLVNYRANGSGMVYIMLPSGSPNEAAAYRLSTDIADVLRKGGVRPSNIATETYAAQSAEPEKFHEQFAADVPAAEASLMAATQRPVTEGALAEPSKAASWKTIPSYAIYGSADQNIPPAVMKFMADRAHAVKTVVIEGASHALMISHPGEVVSLIEDAAKAP